MQLRAIITREELASVVEQITPLRVTIRSRRVITLGRPAKVELVAGAGLRLQGDARFIWDTYGVTIPVTLQSWQVLIVPSFVARGERHVLAFEPVLEELDLKNVPSFLAARIADAVRGGLAAQHDKLAWDFEKHLSIARVFPESFTPAGDYALGPTGGNVTVTPEELRLTLTFAARITREGVPASLRGATKEEKAPPPPEIAVARS